MQLRVRVQEGLQLVLHVSFHIATPPGLEKGLRISNIERSTFWIFNIAMV